MLLIILIFPIRANADTGNLTFKNMKYPYNINQAQNFKIDGIIESKYKISKIIIGFTKDGKTWIPKQVQSININKNTFNLNQVKNINSALLNYGNYIYRIIIYTSDGKNHVINKSFKVYPLISNTKISNVLKVNNKLNSNGVIKGHSNINKIIIGITKDKRVWYKKHYLHLNPILSHNLNNHFYKLNFNSLGKGKYYYRIFISTKNNIKIIYDQPLNVVVPGTTIASYSKKFLNRPYKLNGNSLLSGTDCAGFVRLVYKKFDFYLPRGKVSAQKYYGYSVLKKNWKAGDVIFYQKGKNRYSHMAIYLGNKKIIHESRPGVGVKINTYNKIGMKITDVRRHTNY